MTKLRELGVRLVIYIDDILTLAESQETARDHTLALIFLLENLGKELSVQETRPEDRIRCLPDRMGSHLTGHSNRRPVVPSRERLAHKLSGTAGSIVCSPVLLEEPEEHMLRQHHSSGLHQQLGRHSVQATALAQELWLWCLERGIHLTAQHLPGKENVIADAESRVMRDRSNWMLNVIKIQETLGPLEVDLFASRLTTQLPRFYSWRLDPLAEATNAFLQDWRQVKGYANPPWNLVGRD